MTKPTVCLSIIAAVSLLVVAATAAPVMRTPRPIIVAPTSPSTSAPTESTAKPRLDLTPLNTGGAGTSEESTRRPRLGDTPAATPLETGPQAAFRSLLVQKQETAAQIAADMAAFANMPPDVQETVAGSLVKGYGGRSIYNSHLLQSMSEQPPKVMLAIAPYLAGFWPADASSTESIVLTGRNLDAGTQVFFNGTPVVCWVVTIWGQPPFVSFRIPAAGVSYGSSYPVWVVDGGLQSNTLSFPVVAPRGYRGINGFKFANVGNSTIPWSVFRDYFGASNVEWPDGMHKLGPDSWYYQVYAGSGSGGNCYGFSLTSLRIHNWDMGSLLYSGWWSAHRLSRVWDYASDVSSDQVFRSIQEMQGSQMAEPQFTTLYSALGNQGANAAWDKAHSLQGLPAPHGIVQAMIGPSIGHAIVPYGVGPDGASRNFLCYDNNNPYSTTEGAGPNPNQPVDNRTANTFSYGSYTQTAVFDLTELLVAPSLPFLATSAGLGSAGQSSYLALTKPASLAQITDEAGHTFYTPGGQVNTGPDRIPGAYYTPPIMGGPVPDSYPHTWLFAGSNGKTLKLDVNSGPAGAKLLFTQQGLLTDIQTDGARFSLTNVGVNTTNSRLILENPGTAAPRLIRLIHTPNSLEERAFEIQGISRTLNQPLEIGLDASRNALVLVNHSAAPTNVQVLIRHNASDDHSATQPIALTVAARQAGILQPTDWRQITGQDLNLELQTLAGVRQNVQRLRPR